MTDAEAISAAPGAERPFDWRVFLRWPDAADEIVTRMLQLAPLGAALIVAPTLLSSAVDLPKRLLLECAAIVGITALVASRLERDRPIMTPVTWLAPVVAWLAVSGVSAFASVNPGLAFEQVRVSIALAAVAGLAAWGLPVARRPEVIAAVLLAGGIEAVYGILQYAGIDFLPWASSWGSRCFGTIGNPIFYAEFLAPVFVLGAALLVAEADEEKKDLLALLSLLLFLALVFAQTRSAWIGSAAGLVVAGIALSRARGGASMLAVNRTWLLSFGGFALAVVLTISSQAVFGKNALPIKDRVKDLFNPKGWTVQHRLILWKAGGLMLRDAPVLGHGPDHYRSQFPLQQAKFREAVSKQGLTFAPKEQKAHNDYVQHAAETGIVGLGVWLWLLLAVLRTGWFAATRSVDPREAALYAGLLGGAVALVLDAAFNFPFRTPPAATVFFLSAGLLAAGRMGAPADAPPAASSRGRRGLQVALAAGAAVLVWRVTVPEVRADRLYARGEAQLNGGFVEMAEGDLEMSLKLRPHDPFARYLRAVALEKGSVYDWTGHGLDRALHEYETALALGLHDELLYARLGMLYERKSHYVKAVRMGELAERIYPEYADHGANLAYWLGVREQTLDRALDLVSRSSAAVPQHPLYRWTRALLLEKLGRFREAASELATAIPLHPNVQNGAYYVPDMEKDLARIRKKGGLVPPRARPVLPRSDLRTF